VLLSLNPPTPTCPRNLRSMAKTVYEVRAEGNYVYTFGARWTRAEAEQLLAESEGRCPPAMGPDCRLWIEEIDTTGLFQIPPRPTPRERYMTRISVTSSIPTRAGFPDVKRKRKVHQFAQLKSAPLRAVLGVGAGARRA
jgi:hypothetical protein